MDENMITSEMFDTNNKTIFEGFEDSIQLIINCLRVVLNVKQKQKLFAKNSWEVLPPNITTSEIQLMDDYMTHLNSYNQTILLQLIRRYCNSSLNETIEGPNEEKKFPFGDEWYVVSIWSVIFVSMVLFAIFGNSLIIWIILRQKVMRTVVNIFLLNLTLSDLLTVSFNATFNFVFMLTGDWPFSYAYCVINNFISNLTIASSVFTATVMSIDRYVAIVHPLTARMSRRRAVVSITLIWLCSAFFASPTIMYSTIITIPYNNQNERTLCLIQWPDGFPPNSNYDLAYNIAFLLLTYILPMITMAVAYTLMARVLWDSRQNPLESNIQKELTRSKQKCVRMLIAVISIFGICWLPYHLYFLCTYKWPHIIKIKHIKHIYLGIYWLAMANSLFNPIILFIMNKRFRLGIKYYMRCHCFTGHEIALDHRSTGMSALTTRLSTPRLKMRINEPEKNDQVIRGNKRNRRDNFLSSTV